MHNQGLDTLLREGQFMLKKIFAVFALIIVFTGGYLLGKMPINVAYATKYFSNVLQVGSCYSGSDSRMRCEVFVNNPYYATDTYVYSDGSRVLIYFKQK